MTTHDAERLPKPTAVDGGGSPASRVHHAGNPPGPVHLTSYRDVHRALHDARLQTLRPLTVNVRGEGVQGDQGVETLPPSRATPRMGEAMHEALREHLTAEALEDLRQFLKETIRTAINRATATGKLEVVAEVAYHVPACAMAELLGLRRDGLAALRPCLMALSRGYELDASITQRQRALLARTTLSRWVSAQLRHHPKTPLVRSITGALSPTDGGDSTVASWCTLLLFGGIVSTAGFLASAIATLLAHPTEARWLAGRPHAMNTAIKELTRYSSPLRVLPRVSAEAVAIGSHSVQPGQPVYLMIGYANRDPEKFRSPERLELARVPNPHLAFGSGIASCIGTQLAHLEAQVVLSQMVQLLPRMVPDGDVQWSDSQFLTEPLKFEVAIV